MSAEDSLIEANPCKLRNGNWGAKTAEPVEAGNTVQIVTRAGKTWRAEVTTVVWTDGTVCICETASQASGQSADRKQPQKQRGQAKKPAAKSRAESDATVETDAYGTPAYAADTPPTAVDAPSDELDAMADRAAEASGDDEADLMAAYEAMADDDTRR